MPIYLQHGNLIDYVPPTDTSTEDVVFMGGLVGIPQAFIPAGELGALSVDGVYMFTKKDGVSVNLGEVVKYCGTTKLAQDSNADLTLGVAVADAEADSLGVKVKINSVLPSSGGGGGGGGGEVAVCGASGLYFDGDVVAICYCGQSAIRANDYGVYLAICGASGLSIQNGQLVASGGGGGGGSGDGLQNFATGTASLSILGSPTTSEYSVTIGAYANASENGSVAIGRGATVSDMGGCGSIAIGANAKSLSPLAGGGNIVIGSGSNPYTDSALLVIHGIGVSSSEFRQGVLFYAPSSDFTEVSGASSNGGIALVSSQNTGSSWTISCNLSF